MKKVVILVLFLCLITGCTEKGEKTDAMKFKEEYEKLNGQKQEKGVYSTITIPEDNAIIYSNVGEILSLLENGTGIIYFGYPECPWCRSAIGPLLNSANMVGIDHIYYVNAKDMRDQKHLDENGNIVIDKKGTEEYEDLLKALDIVLPSYKGLKDDTTKRLYVPSVVFVKEGQIVKYHEGTVESQTDPNILLTEKEEKELVKIYSDAMHKVLGDVCDESC